MPKRDDVFETLKTELKTITIANGYNYNIGLVDRIPKSIDELNVSDFPAVFVIDNGAEIPTTFNDAYAITIHHNLEITLLVFFRADSSLHTEFGKFVADIMELLYKPPVFLSGGTAFADNFRLLRLDTVLTAPPHMIAIFTVGCTYSFNKGTP
jgi:hypothetical protein